MTDTERVARYRIFSPVDRKPGIPIKHRYHHPSNDAYIRLSELARRLGNICEFVIQALWSNQVTLTPNELQQIGYTLSAFDKYFSANLNQRISETPHGAARSRLLAIDNFINMIQPRTKLSHCWPIDQSLSNVLEAVQDILSTKSAWDPPLQFDLYDLYNQTATIGGKKDREGRYVGLAGLALARAIYLPYPFSPRFYPFSHTSQFDGLITPHTFTIPSTPHIFQVVQDRRLKYDLLELKVTFKDNEAYVPKLKRPRIEWVDQLFGQIAISTLSWVKANPNKEFNLPHTAIIYCLRGLFGPQTFEFNFRNWEFLNDYIKLLESSTRDDPDLTIFVGQLKLALGKALETALA